MTTDIDKIISLAKKVNDLVGYIATDEITVDDLKELSEIFPTIDNLLSGFGDWLEDKVPVTVPATKTPAPTIEEKKKPVEKKKPATSVKKRPNMTSKDIIKIAEKVKSLIPDEGISVSDKHFRTLLKNALAEYKALFTSSSVLYRFLNQITYKNITNHYWYVDEDGKLRKPVKI
jgi:hypothetical protein